MHDSDNEHEPSTSTSMRPASTDRMDVDVDGDIGPGCYVLDIGIDNLRFQKIWIRSDYIRLYDHCDYRYRLSFGLNRRSSCVFITGQPGIGRPFFALSTFN